jgi:hypothetical protein
MRAISMMVALVTVLTTLAGTKEATAVGRSTEGHPALRQVFQHFAPAVQTSADEDEMGDLEIAPIDESLGADKVMRSRPFVLADGAEKAFPIDNFARTEPLSEEEARAQLQRFLELRGVDGAKIDAALTSFDSRKVKRVVPAPTLRATLLMLTDWKPYEATIRAVLDGDNPSGKPYASVGFDEIGMAGAIATLYEDPRTGRHSMVVGSDYEGESPEQLIPVMVHESLHGGGGNSAEEELVANILDTICYGELLGIDPDVADQGTELAFFNNLELLALLNSTGRGGPSQVGTVTSPLGDVFVGPDLGDFDYESIRYVVEADDFYDSLRNEGSPGQQTTAALLSRFSGGKELGPAPHYDEHMLAIIDRGVGRIIRPERAVQLAKLLGLQMTIGVHEESAEGKLGSKLSLEDRPFVPRDLSLFDQRGAKRPGKPLTEEGSRKALEGFLAKSQLAADTRQALLARYDDPATAQLIADPSLRAATLMLGAVKPWDLALGVILDGNNPEGVPLQVLFADLRSSAPADHQSDTEGDGTPPAILVNSLLVGEPPELLASVIVEGTLLHDDTRTDQEAIAAALMGTLAYGDIVAVDPALVKAKTWGVMNRNRDTLALLNSAAFAGDPKTPSNADSIGFLSAPNAADDILPGLYADATSFAEYEETMPVASRYDRISDLESPPVFTAYLDFAGIEPTSRFRGIITFSEETMAEVDAGLGGFLTRDEVLAVGKTLKLGVAA